MRTVPSREKATERRPVPVGEARTRSRRAHRRKGKNREEQAPWTMHMIPNITLSRDRRASPTRERIKFCVA